MRLRKGTVAFTARAGRGCILRLVDKNRDDDRVSLEGLDPVEALKALLAVDPDAPPVDEAAEGKPERESAERQDPPHQ